MEKIINYGGQVLYPWRKEGNVGHWSYRCMNHAIRIYNASGKFVACLTNGLQANVTELDGCAWYGYGDVSGLSFESYSEENRAVREVFEALGYEAVQRGFMDWIYTRKTA